MLLASVADIVGELGFDSMTDINEAVIMALDAAEPQLSAILNTEFDSGTFIDTFYVPQPPYRDGPAVRTDFRLRRGVLSSVTSVLTTTDPTAFGDPTSYTDVTSVVTTLLDKGVIRDWQTHYNRQFVQITYAAGFGVSLTDPTSYNLTQVPSWLQEAAKLKAKITLADSPVLSEANIKLDKKMLGLAVGTLLSRHIRYAPAALLPM